MKQADGRVRVPLLMVFHLNKRPVDQAESGVPEGGWGLIESYVMFAKPFPCGAACRPPFFYSGDDDCAADDDDDVDIDCVVFVCIAAWSRAILFRGIRRSPVSRCSVGCHEQEELHGTGKWNLTPFIAAVS